MGDKITVPHILKMKQGGELITCLTAYDYSFARILDQAGVEMLLVGDSLGCVVQGNPNTLAVTLDEMVYHTRTVARGRKRALVLRKETIQALSSKDLEAVAGGVESRTIPTLCLTVKTCASFEFAC